MFLRQLTLSMALLGVMAAGRSQAPEVSCTPEDRARFESLMEQLQAVPAASMGPTMIAVGTHFLEIPYVAGTLEMEGEERLVVNLKGLDCTTFVENVLAISRMKTQGTSGWDAYLQVLERIRYREGRVQGYPSRLHYFTDWIRENEKKGLVRDITPQIGGVSVVKEINFMGTHPELYPALSREADLAAIRSTEAALSSKPLFVLPAAQVAAQEQFLQEGDIIALATSIPGLDVTHTGIAMTGADGRMHLLHASTAGAVMISREPLAAYLRDIERNTGIIVVRPLEPGG